MHGEKRSWKLFYLQDLQSSGYACVSTEFLSFLCTLDRRFIDYNKGKKEFQATSLELTFYIDVGNRIPSDIHCFTKTKKLSDRGSTAFVFENGTKFEVVLDAYLSSKSSLYKYYVKHERGYFTILGVFGK